MKELPLVWAEHHFVIATVTSLGIARLKIQPLSTLMWHPNPCFSPVLTPFYHITLYGVSHWFIFPHAKRAQWLTSMFQYFYNLCVEHIINQLLIYPFLMSDSHSIVTLVNSYWFGHPILIPCILVHPVNTATNATNWLTASLILGHLIVTNCLVWRVTLHLLLSPTINNLLTLWLFTQYICIGCTMRLCLMFLWWCISTRVWTTICDECLIEVMQN